MTRIHTTRVVAAMAAVLAGTTIACSGILPRRHELTRPIAAEPSTLAFVNDSDPRGRVGGGVYDGAGNVIVFDMTGGQPPATKLYVTRFSDAGWSAPTLAIPGFDGWHAGAQVSPDGSRLFFESTRRLPPVEGREDSDLWVADRLVDTWVNPRPLGPPFNSPDNEHNVTISARETICINSNRRGVTAGHDILCARRSGNGWESPRPLGAAVNGSSADIAAFIDPEERFLLFASNRAGGSGMFDLYISVARDGEWQPAVNLGSAVNTSAAESNPALSRDGRRLLFTRSSGDRVVPHEIRFDPRWLDGAALPVRDRDEP